jgi:DNA mismatch endonuclease, patch repair protein
MTEAPDKLRRRTMQAVKSKDTKPEWIVRRLLHTAGYRYRLHVAQLPGKPDIVFPTRHKIILVHGCFWHGHTCKRGARLPHSNTEYWQQKISKNCARDLHTKKLLTKAGWAIHTVWECELKNQKRLLNRLSRFLNIV